MVKVNVSKTTEKSETGKVWRNYFDNYRRAQKFAKEHGAKVERTGKTTTPYVVITVGVCN